MNLMRLTLLVLTLISTNALAQVHPFFHVKGVRLVAAYEEDKLKMIQALQLFEKVMNDKEFQQKLSDTTFLFDIPDDPMRKLTSKQIVDTLFSGREWYDADSDHTADIIWVCNKRRYKPPFTTAIGYGNENDSTINSYIFFVRSNELKYLVSNLAHEWSHKIGFDHQDKDHPTREQTVPYLFGNLVEKFCPKHMPNN